MMKKLLSYLVVGVISGFLFWNIFQNWEAVSKISWNLKSTNSIFLVSLLLLVYFSNIISWHTVTKALGARVGFQENFKLWMISNLSRFLPGGIWQYPSRVYLLSRHGVSKTIGVTAVVLESILNLGIGAAVVFLSLAFWQLPNSLEKFRGLLLIFLFFVLLALVLMNKKIITPFFKLVKKVTGREVNIAGGVTLPAKWILPLILLFFLKFVFIGTALFFLIRLSVPFDIHLLPVLVGMFALSWLLGYITMISPAGLGVQEISIAAMLSLYMSFPMASVIAILFRLVLLLAEAITVLFVSTIFKRSL